jgi:Mg-chelatase subunit ChlD
MVVLPLPALLGALVGLLGGTVLLVCRGSRSGVRALAIGLAIGGALGVAVPSGGPRTRIVLIDVSDSTAGEGEGFLGDPSRWAAGLDPADRVGVLVFAGHPVRVIPPTPLAEIDRASLALPDTSTGEGTDLEAALEAARGELPPDGRAEILLATDGRATRGAIEAVLSALRGRGVAVDVHPLGHRAAADVRVEHVDAPASADPGETVTVLVDVAGPPGAGVAIRLFSGDSTSSSPTLRGHRTTRLGADGRARVGFTAEIPESWMVWFRAVVGMPSMDDPLRENDRALAVVEIRGPPTVLALSGTGSGGPLARRLGETGLRVATSSTRAGIPRDVRDAALILLEDVAAREMPPDLGERVAGGAGLLVVGGRRAFGAGGFAGRPVEDLLPLRSRREDDGGLTVDVLVDVSGSMAAPFRDRPDGKRKCEAARDAVEALLGALPRGARARVVPFAKEPRAGAAIVVGEEAGRERLEDVVRSLAEEVGGGTDLLRPLREAHERLASVTGRRHLVVISDGEVGEDETVRDAIRREGARLEAAGVSVTVVATGLREGAREILEAVAAPDALLLAGDADELARRVLEDVDRELGEGLRVEGPARTRRGPGAVDGDPIAEGVPLDGWLRTWTRGDGRVVLETDGEDPWPLLAVGTHGLGRVGAIPTSPGVDGWAPETWGEPGFWRALVRRLARRSDASPAMALTREAEGGLALTVTARDGAGRFRKLDRPRLRDGTELRSIGAGRYRCILPEPRKPEPGGTPLPVVVHVVTGEGELLARRALAVPPRRELAATGPDRARLRSLRDRTGAASVAAPGRSGASWAFLVLAAALVVLDAAMALRRRREDTRPGSGRRGSGGSSPAGARPMEPVAESRASGEGERG